MMVVRKKQVSHVLGNIPGRLQAQLPTAAENHFQDHRTAAGGGNYCLGDPEIQGQLCFNKPGNVPPL